MRHAPGRSSSLELTRIRRKADVTRMSAAALRQRHRSAAGAVWMIVVDVPLLLAPLEEPDQSSDEEKHGTNIPSGEPGAAWPPSHV
jgi:hypothetical protein